MADYGTAILDGLLSLVNPSNLPKQVAGAARALGAASAQEVGTNPLPAMMGQAYMQTGPYQEGASKALKKLGEQHVMEAAQAGVPPTQIQAHPMMQQTQQPMAQEAPQQAPSGPQQTAPQAPPASQGGGFQSPLALLGALLGYKAGQIDPNTGVYTPASILGIQGGRLEGQQAANLVPGTQVAIEKAKAEQVPPTQYQQKSLEAGSYQAQISVVKDELDKVVNDKTALQNQLKTVLEHPFQSMGSGTSAKDLITKITDLNTYETKVHQKLADLFDEAPNMKANQAIPKGATHFSPSTRKYYDSKGNVVS